MLVMLLLLMLEVPGRPGAVVPREALEIVGDGAEVSVGAGVETKEKKVAKKRMVKRPTSMPATETLTAVKEAAHVQPFWRGRPQNGAMPGTGV